MPRCSRCSTGSASTSRPTRRSPSCRSPSGSWSRSPRRCRSMRASGHHGRADLEPDRSPRPTRLLQVIAELKADGVSVIFISHRLNEVERCADRVVVLRDGRVVGELDARRDHPRRDDPADDRPRPQGALHAAGGAARRRRCSRSTACAPPTYPDQRGRASTLRRGEILGLAGLVGAGRTELARAVFGVDRPLGGAIRARRRAGRDRARRATRSTAGIYLVPEDRKRAGPAARRLDRREHLAARPRRLRARPASCTRDAETRERRAPAARGSTSRTPTVGDAGRHAVRRQPAEGRARQVAVDAPARHHLRRADARHRRRRQERDLRADARARRCRASPILMISSDMEEVIGVSDRIAVMHEGRISGFLERARVQRAQRAAARRRHDG